MSGCFDNQTSADFYDDWLKQYGGALTNNILWI